MRIGIDIRVLGTGRISGVEEYTRQLVAHLLPLDTGITFKLFAAGRQPTAYDPAWLDMPNVVAEITRRSNRALSLSMRIAGRPRLDRLVGGADVFFFPHIIYGSRSPSCRSVVTFHDLSYERFKEFFSWRQRFWHRVQMVPARQAKEADRIIAVSHSTARDLTERYGIPSGRIAVIHSGVAPDMGPRSVAQVRAFRRYRRLPERFILGLCTREPRKNLIGLVKAYELLAARRRDTPELILAGPGGWLERGFRRAISRSAVSRLIRVVGPVPQEERALWYSAASLFVYPSFFEGFGFPPLEAMACGTPVIASHGSSLPEIVGDSGLLVDPYDVRAVAAAMDAVLADGVLAARMSRKGMDRARRFNWQQTAERTLEVLTAAYSPHGGPGRA